MKKNLKKLIPLLLLVMIVPAFTGCDFLGLFGGDESDPDIEILGTWTDAYGGITVTNDSIDAGFWQADIMEFHNSGWNADESDLASGDFGYAVIQYTTASIYVPESQDKYMIFRWQNIGTDSGETSLDYAEGSNYPANTYFDSVSEAKAGATSDAGFFGYFSTVVKQ